MDEEEIQQHIDDNNGYCTTCKAVTNDGGVEPDAEGYRCDECGSMTVMGIEQALICGHLI